MIQNRENNWILLTELYGGQLIQHNQHNQKYWSSCFSLLLQKLTKYYRFTLHYDRSKYQWPWPRSWQWEDRGRWRLSGSCCDPLRWLSTTAGPCQQPVTDRQTEDHLRLIIKLLSPGLWHLRGLRFQHWELWRRLRLSDCSLWRRPSPGQQTGWKRLCKGTLL